MEDAPPPVTPYLYYEDATAALRFLVEAFGLQERADETMRGEDGQVVHAALDAGAGGRVMLGCPGADYRCPRALGQATQSLYVYVGDAEAHHERARAAGATIVEEPAETFYGDVRYGAEDPEGHVWYFATKRRAVGAKDSAPSGADLEGHGSSG